VSDVNAKLQLLALSVALVSSTFPAVGQSPPGARQTAAKVDACALVARQDAEAVLGIRLGEPIRDDLPPYIFTCRYGKPETGRVDIGVTSHKDAAEAVENFQQDIRISRYPEISGLGDRAYDASPALGITVLKGRYSLMIEVRQAGYRNDIEAAKKLATKALSRLK
jgi:hypothetical protein